MGPDWFERYPFPEHVSVWFLRGTRCWLRACDAPAQEHPACRRMLEAYELEPVIERSVPVRRLEFLSQDDPRRDLDFPWCVARTDELRLGLYRVKGRRTQR